MVNSHDHPFPPGVLRVCLLVGLEDLGQVLRAPAIHTDITITTGHHLSPPGRACCIHRDLTPEIQNTQISQVMFDNVYMEIAFAYV